MLSMPCLHAQNYIIGAPVPLEDELDGMEVVFEGYSGGSRNLVGIAIQLSDSEEEEFFVGYPMLISPEKFDFGIE